MKHKKDFGSWAQSLGILCYGRMTGQIYGTHFSEVDFLQGSCCLPSIEELLSRLYSFTSLLFSRYHSIFNPQQILTGHNLSAVYLLRLEWLLCFFLFVYGVVGGGLRHSPPSTTKIIFRITGIRRRELPCSVL